MKRKKIEKNYMAPYQSNTKCVQVCKSAKGTKSNKVAKKKINQQEHNI